MSTGDSEIQSYKHWLW